MTGDIIEKVYKMQMEMREDISTHFEKVGDKLSDIRTEQAKIAKQVEINKDEIGTLRRNTRIWDGFNTAIASILALLKITS